MTEEIDAKVMPEEIFVSRFVHGEACAFKVTLNNLTKYYLHRPATQDAATRAQSGSAAGLVEALESILKHTANYCGCVCNKGDCGAGDCWPCRMQRIGGTADEALAAYRKENGHE